MSKTQPYNNFIGGNQKITDSGLIIEIDEDKNQFTLLGCPSCFKAKVSQDELGHPLINGEHLVSAYDVPNLPNNITSVIKANLWFCPNCMKPFTELLPKFF